jgi:hypothetical protein
LLLENRNAKLRIEADLNGVGQLMAPCKGKMREVIKEGLSGEVKITLFNKDDAIIHEDRSSMAGIEIHF